MKWNITCSYSVELIWQWQHQVSSFNFDFPTRRNLVNVLEMKCNFDRIDSSNVYRRMCDMETVGFIVIERLSTHAFESTILCEIWTDFKGTSWIIIWVYTVPARAISNDRHCQCWADEQRENILNGKFSGHIVDIRFAAVMKLLIPISHSV